MIRPKGSWGGSNLSSAKQIWAVAKKEFIHEFRSPAGIMTSALFGTVSVVVIALTTADVSIDPTISAGLLWVVLLFAGLIAMPRAFLNEEEQGTGDLLRLIGNSESIYWGKGLFNFVLMQTIGLLICVLFIGLTGQPIIHASDFIIGLVGGCASIAGAVTLCSAIAARSSNATTLTAAIALPMLLFLVNLGTTGMRTAFGADHGGRGLIVNAALVAYAIGTYAIGSMIFPAVWKK